MEEINLNGNTNNGNSSSDDEVVVGEDRELAESTDPVNGTSSSHTNFTASTCMEIGEKPSLSDDMSFFQFETKDNDDLFGERPLPDWVGWRESPDVQIGGSSKNPFVDDVTSPLAEGPIISNGSSTPMDSCDGSQRCAATGSAPSLFEEDVEFVGVELEGTEKAMEQALKEGIVGEAGPLKRNISSPNSKSPEKESAGMKEFNDANYWRVDQEVSVLE